MDIYEEKELIKQAQKDPAAFSKLYNHFYPKIFGYILRRTGSLEVAQDITSETFFKALNKLWQFRFRSISISSWLYKIATNEINQYFRKLKYKVISLDKLEQEGFEPLVEDTPMSEMIEAQEKLKQHKDFIICQKKISNLSIKYQEVLTLRFFEEKKIREVAEILEKSEGTIKSLLHRGLEKLRIAMDEETAAQLFIPSRIVESERSIQLSTITIQNHE